MKIPSRLRLVGSLLVAVAIVTLGAWLSSDARAAGKRARTYEITVTNLTRGQVISPPFVVVHDGTATPLWVSGEAASAGLAAIAEDADVSVLTAALDGATGVISTNRGAGPIPPGGSGTVEIDARGRGTVVSLVAMLVQTNDAFVGAQSVELPKRRGQSTVVRSPGYDAGSEENNEDGAFIPGPPFGNGGVRATANAEGFVHVHSGIVGGVSLDPAVYDWRNPTAEIRITRIQ